MLDGQGYDISCDLVMKVSVGWSYWTGKSLSNYFPSLTLYFHYQPTLTIPTINK